MFIFRYACCSSIGIVVYVSVKNDYKFNPKIRKEVLANLYIPESDKVLADLNIKEKIAGKSFLDALIDEALILTKNYADTLKVKKAKGGRIAWNPSGTVRVWDTRLNQLIPLTGVRVQAQRWFTYYTVTTDQNGFYQSPWGFDRPANYSLYFDTWAFDVRSGTFGQAWIDGPKQDEPWNVDLWNGLERFYAHVFRAAFRYHFGDIGGLTRPFLGHPLKYAAFDETGEAQGVNIGNWSIFGTNPNILVYRFVAIFGELDSDEIFSVTSHETAHSTHPLTMNAGVIQFGQVDNRIAESWATAVEWHITQLE